MQLSKPDIFQAAIVGLALVASAAAVPMIASGSKTLHPAQPNVQNIQQLAQRQCSEMASAQQSLSNAHEHLMQVANNNESHQKYALQDTEQAMSQVQEALNLGKCLE
jgi:uncharacterized protein with von Willebrand factor type A (vWA) domain